MKKEDDATSKSDDQTLVRVTISEGFGLISGPATKLNIRKDYLEIGFFRRQLRKKDIKSIREAGILCIFPRIPGVQRTLKISIGHDSITIWPSFSLGKILKEHLELYGYTVECCEYQGKDLIIQNIPKLIAVLACIIFLILAMMLVLLGLYP